MGARAVSVGSVGERVPALLNRLRGVHRRMVSAALTGDGYERIAELAAVEIGKPVAIVIPECNVSVLWPRGPNAVPLDEIEIFIDGKARGGVGKIPDSVELLVAITFEREFQGAAAMLAGGAPADDDAGEFVHLAAMASATALALEKARELEVADQAGARAA